MSELQIYLARDNQQAGPFSLEQINDMLASNAILLTDLMWHVGMSEWKSIGEMTQGRYYYQPSNQSTPSEQTKPNNTSPTIKAASVGKRIIAKLIDWSILFIPQIIIYLSFINHEIISQLTVATTSAEQNKIILEFAQTLPSWVNYSIICYTLFILFIQNDMIRQSGQSVGKKICKLKIVDAQNYQLVGSHRSFFMRSFLFFMIFQLSQLFQLLAIILIIDVILFFYKNHQTLHDRLAKTKVIDVN